MKPGRFLVVFMTVICLTLGVAAAAGAEEMKKYTVQPGDTLWGISEKFYGNKELWPKLWQLNEGNVTNPHQLTVGDVLTIYPIDMLTSIHQPPPPPKVDRNLYERNGQLNTSFPQYFTFVADPRGIAGTGVHRIKVKRIDPESGRLITSYDEIRQAGQIIASMESGWIEPDPTERVNRDDFHGKQLLATGDNVIVHFNQDVAKVLDSATHEDPDPYFRSFAVYGLGKDITQPDDKRYDAGAYMGQLHVFKGLLTIVARVETLAPMTDGEAGDLANTAGNNQDTEPVSYVARITYSEDSIDIGDKVFMFKSLYPGPDREIGGKKLHNAEEYRDYDE